MCKIDVRVGLASKRTSRSFGTARAAKVPHAFGDGHHGGTVDPTPPHYSGDGIVGPQTAVGHPVCSPPATT